MSFEKPFETPTARMAAAQEIVAHCTAHSLLGQELDQVPNHIMASWTLPAIGATCILNYYRQTIVCRNTEDRQRLDEPNVVMHFTYDSAIDMNKRRDAGVAFGSDQESRLLRTVVERPSTPEELYLHALDQADLTTADVLLASRLAAIRSLPATTSQSLALQQQVA